MIGLSLLSPATGPLELPAQLSLLLEQSPGLSAIIPEFSAILPELSAIQAMIPDFPDIELPDVGFDRLADEWSAFKSRIPEPWKLNNDGREFKVGERLRDRGLSAKYPIVLVPGIVSTVCYPF